MIAITELKPCPFCGGAVQMEKAKIRSDYVVCRNTGNLGGTCAMDQVPSRTPEAAAGRWNMRKPMELLEAENEALVAAAQALRDEWRKDQADAERYRWLRDEAKMRFKPAGSSAVVKTAEETDAAIDAAMRKGVGDGA